MNVGGTGDIADDGREYLTQRKEIMYTDKREDKRGPRSKSRDDV